ncbi:MAG TPA: substrate-binding domain-containing protein, partial [Ornithinibacter sp.]|nr:substrate-binding domain-containing protein [Ornithinibacter sp.]
MSTADAVSSVALASLLLGACAGSPALEATGTASARAGQSEPGVVTVLAAASLATPLTTLAEAYEAQHPGTTVRLSFGSSTTLARQV